VILTEGLFLNGEPVLNQWLGSDKVPLKPVYLPEQVQTVGDVGMSAAPRHGLGVLARRVERRRLVVGVACLPQPLVR